MENKKLTKKEQNDIIIQYVKRDLLYMTKAELRDILNDICNTDIKKSATKHELATAIIKACGNRKTPYFNIYEKYKSGYFGVNLYEVEQTFNINSYKRKQLKEYGLLRVAYMYEKDYMYFSVYNLEDFFSLLGEDLDLLLKEKRRIYKNKQIQK